MTTAQEILTSSLQTFTSYTRDRISQLRNPRNRSYRPARRERPVDVSQIEDHQLYKSASASFRETIDRVGTFAPYSVILGRCDDNLPLLLELNNPAPGSILVTGDEGAGKVRLVHSFIKSAVLLNSPGRVQFSVIAREPAWYQPLARYPNCLQISTPDSPEALQLVETLSAEEELSRKKGPSRRAMLLILDDLSTISDVFSHKHTSRLFRLIKHGPRARIWPVGILQSNRSGNVHEKVIGAFRTRLIGKIASSILAASFAGEDGSPVCELESGNQFCVPVNGDWMVFRNF